MNQDTISVDGQLLAAFYCHSTVGGGSASAGTWTSAPKRPLLSSWNPPVSSAAFPPLLGVTAWGQGVL